MTLEEYKKGIEEIEMNAEMQKHILRKKYADANNPYKIGDIIKDHASIIKIENMSYWLSADNPQYVFRGIKLNKDLSHNKKGFVETIYQSNIKPL